MSQVFQLKGNHTVGVISDTHGPLCQEAARALKGSDLIIHAGDLGTPLVLEELSLIAPVIAVRGNMDCEAWAYDLPRTEVVEFHGGLLYVLHNISNLDINPVESNIRAIISGHTHLPSVVMKDGVLYVNPGSAGLHRHTIPPSVALVHIRGKSVDARVITLKV